MQTGQESYCSQLSSEADEPLAGSAPSCAVYFLLEYTGAWESQAFESSALPDAVKDHLDQASLAIPGSKTLLIRRRSQPSAPTIHFYIAVSQDEHPALYAFSLADYHDLLKLDLPAIVRRDPEYQVHQQASPLYLVCAHGRRDRCCAKFGLPVFEELQRLVDDDAWQCSHMGGHRFAANVLLMPHGLLYGRLTVEKTAELVERTGQGLVLLDNLRGRSAYPAQAQAGEVFLRQQTGKMHLDDYRLLEVTSIEPGRWLARFVDLTTTAEHTIQVSVEKTDISVYESCALEKQTLLTRYYI